MAMNRLRFQQDLSLSEFVAVYRTEPNCGAERTLTPTLSRKRERGPDVWVQPLRVLPLSPTLSRKRERGPRICSASDCGIEAAR